MQGTRGGAVQVRLLGQVAAIDGEPIAIGGPTQRRVLAALALGRGDAVPVRRLVDVVWSDGDPPDRAEHNVRTYVHRLRSSFGAHDDLIETSGAGYRLAIEPDDLDVTRFERLATTSARLASTGDVISALDAIEDAERMWRGGPLGEFELEPWARPEVVRLEELHTELRSRHAELLIEVGRPADAVAELEALVRDEPLRETPRASLMRALYESGRQADALRAFQDFRRLLGDEVGTEPSPELVALDRSIAIGELASSMDRTRTVAGYELHERIGEGAFAVVHRAVQVSLGREVAVKIVRAELANQPEFIRRFEAEAHMVARIEHPNVVPLYDYWREPDRAFLVMRWMTGGTLEQRLDEGPWTLPDTIELIDQIAGALDAAHGRGVVHRDVKPANILFDDAGRAYLGDFGIALDAETRARPEAALSEGSPVFASPEQLRREPVGPEADVHALGIVAYNLLMGRTPFADASDGKSELQHQLHDPVPVIHPLRSNIPVAVDDAIAIATAKDPSDRYSSARGFADALRRAADDDGVVDAIARERGANPYKGLRAFDETDASDFHGRDRLVDELVHHLRQPDRRLVALIGPSGSGKSSVARAGLVPALREGRVPGSTSWFTTTMTPGPHPFEALETALLRVAVNPPASLLDQLRDGPRGILRGVRRILPDDDATVLMVVDQFEELFTANDDAVQLRFLDALTTALTEPGSPLRVVLTLRADFHDRPLRHPEFAPLLKRNTVVVTPLAPDELEQAITLPAAAAGVAFEQGLVAEIVADVNHQPGALPLLQYALTQAFDVSEGNSIAIDDYRSVGGLAGALGRRAEDLWRSSPTDEQEVTRRLFGRLVALGEGTEDTRRRVSRSELGDEPSTTSVIDRYGAARLLSFDLDPATREPTVEIAHEALIREWSRLREWLDEDRAELHIHRHLTAAATGWVERDRDPNELYRGARLDAAEPLLDSDTVHLNPTEAEFLEAGLERRDVERAEERVRVRRLRRLVSATAVVAAVALVAGAVALVQWRRADDQAAEAADSADLAEQRSAESGAARDEAVAAQAATETALQDAESARSEAERQRDRADEQAELAAERLAASDLARLRGSSLEEFELNTALGLLLAVEAYNISPDRDSEAALHRLLARTDGLEATVPGPFIDVQLVDDGATAVAVGVGHLTVVDVLTRTSYEIAGVDAVTGGRIDVSDRIIASVGLDRTKLIDLETGVVHTEMSGTYSDASFSPDGTELALVQDDAVVIWDVTEPTDPEPIEEIPTVAAHVKWHPSLEQILTVGPAGSPAYWSRTPDGWNLVWGVPGEPGQTTGEIVSEFDPDGGVVAMATKPDGSSGLVIRAHATATGDEIGTSIESAPDVKDLLWLDEERLMATSGAEPIVFDLRSGSTSEDPIGARTAFAIESSVSLDRIISAGTLGLQIWNPDRTSALERRFPLTDAQRIAPPDSVKGSISADGSLLLVTAAFPEVPNVTYDLTAEEPAPHDTDVSWPMMITGDGYLRISPRGMERLDADFEPVGVPAPIHGDIGGIFPSPTGEYFGFSDDEGAWLYEADGDLVGRLEVPGAVRDQAPHGFSFSADGSEVMISLLDGNLAWARFDTATGEMTDHGDGTKIIRPLIVGDAVYAQTARDDFTIHRFDVETFDREGLVEEGSPLRGNTSPAYFVSESGDGNFVATSSFDGLTRVYDAESGRQLGSALPGVDRAEFAANGSDLVVPDSSGAVSVWNFDTTTWRETACRIAGRNMTRAEWEDHGPETIEYRATCPEFPLPGPGT